MSNCYTITGTAKAKQTATPVPPRSPKAGHAPHIGVAKAFRLALYAVAALAAAVLLFLNIREALGETMPSVLVMLMIGLGLVALTQAGEGRHA